MVAMRRRTLSSTIGFVLSRIALEKIDESSARSSLRGTRGDRVRCSWMVWKEAEEQSRATMCYSAAPRHGSNSHACTFPSIGINDREQRARAASDQRSILENPKQSVWYSAKTRLSEERNHQHELEGLLDDGEIGNSWTRE